VSARSTTGWAATPTRTAAALLRGRLAVDHPPTGLGISTAVIAHVVATAVELDAEAVYTVYTPSSSPLSTSAHAHNALRSALRRSCVSGWLRRKCSPSLRRSSEANSMRTPLGGRERGAHEAPVLHPIVSAREAQRSEPDTHHAGTLGLDAFGPRRVRR
jgi:hypothetical protein